MLARGIESPELRADYLTQICAGDQALRERVEALLAAHEKQQSLLQSDAAVAPTADVSGVTESAGDVIGRYKLLQKIGEGGFGVVYMAEQSRPVRRKVALKVIKPGMDTRAVVARFEAERQALALMDHSNIAKVFDGGATESGRPYFVMELVKGVPITQFCDENKFTVRQRLNLFAAVCRAIQHAHQKGVIHRDIKPSNVLVTLHDGEPVAKVIDFGVSKAISQQLTEKTLFTAHGQMIGTPQYMSPEQAEMSGLDIDTRSDIYSLGILLYELLTGCTPLEPEQIRGTAYLELQRLIREEEPLRPSRRCSTLGEQSAKIAARRQTDPQKLGSQLRGELDWIVMKSLEKDRNRRYESASDLAADVEHFLNDETVVACPPSLAYRFQKLARRNKSLLATAGTIVFLLLIATCVSTGLYIDARTARNEFSLLNRQQSLGTALSLAASGQEEKARQVIDDAKVTDRDRAVLEAIYSAESMMIDFNPKGAKDTLESLDEGANDLTVQAMLAHAHLDSGDFFSYYESPVVHGKAVPETPYEYFYVGKAQFLFNFASSIDYLDDAVALTRSPLSFSYRARSLAFLAASTRNRENFADPEIDSVKLIDRAVEDVDIATRLFKALRPKEGDEAPGIRPGVLVTHLAVFLHAYNIYRIHKLDGKAQEALEAAGEIVQELEDRGIKKKTLGAFGFYHQFHAKYREEQGLAGAEEVKEEATNARNDLMETGYAPWMLVAELIAENFEGTRDKTLEELWAKRKNAHRDKLLTAFHHLLSNDRDSGRSKVYQLIDEMKQDSHDNKQVFEICNLYLLLGDIPALQEYAKDKLRDKDLQDLRFAVEVFKFYAGELDADEFLKNRQNTGGTTFRLWTVGLSELAKGENHRDAALTRFKQMGDEGLFHNVEFCLGPAYVERMERDPSWPPWITNNRVDSAD